MEFTMTILVTSILLLIAALVFATLITGWGTQAAGWVEIVIVPIRDMLFGK